MEHDLCDVNFDLLAKTRSTIEGILVSGRTDIWSTYGALRRASEILNRIFTHNFLVEREEVVFLVSIFSICLHCIYLLLRNPDLDSLSSV